MAKNKYENYTKEQLIAKLKHLERHRYGLVWEDKPEEIADKCANELPVLVEDKSKEIISDTEKPTNFIFEGDNYHTLYTLNFTHKKKIDVIYIDPPYNTGNKSWRYNNDYVDKEDRFRHTKWLSFMNKRLRLAKNLLSNEGIIVCTIDDYEFAPLKLLLDKIFGEQNRLGTVIVVNKAEGRTDDKFLATAHEYMFFYAKNSSFATIKGFNLYEEEKYDKYPDYDEISNFRLKPLRRGGTNSRKIDRPNLFYSIFFNEKTEEISLKKIKGAIEIKPIDSKGIERVWQWGKQRFLENLLTEIVIKQNKNSITGYEVYRKVRFKNTKKVTTVWNSPKYNAAAHGTKILEKILNKNRTFEYPKSLYAVIDSLSIISNKNSIILDFFAGSGTTGHAVLELNKEDGGNRQFILCTNNENKICEEVTYPRIKKVIEGYADKEGIPANVKYFKTDFVPNVLTDKDKRTLVSKSTELLCIAENTFEVVSKKKRKLDYAIFKNSSQHTAIIYDENYIDKCCAELNKIKDLEKTVIYVFSYDHTYEEEDFIELKTEYTVKPIPEAIINVYRKISKLKNK